MRVSRHRPISLRHTVQPPLLEQALAAVANAVFIADGRGVIVWINDAFSRLSGYSAQQALGRTPSFLKSGKQDETFYRELWQTILAGNVWRGEVVERHHDGSLYSVDEVITPMLDEAGAITHFVVIQHDITERQQRGERERYLAYHDALTGLANRVLFLDVLGQAIINAGRRQRTLALLYVDIDNFKSINDTLGHIGGDRMLVAVAERLSAAVRKTDTVARLGGDEFAILQTDLLDAEVATALSSKLLLAMAQPFVLDGHKVYASVSIGISIYPADATAAEDMLRNADRAMYQAKQAGRNGYKVYGKAVPPLAHLEHGARIPESATHSPLPKPGPVLSHVPLRWK